MIRGHRRVLSQPSSAAWNAANFDWVSASSALGSDPATLPQPANSRALSSPTSAAQREPELAVAAGVQPADRPRVATPIHALELADDGGRVVGRRPADRGGG